MVVLARAKEKIGNYRDWIRKNKRDENLRLRKVANEMAKRGLTFSSVRKDEEKKVKEDFEFERRKTKREFWVKLIDSLFLR